MQQTFVIDILRPTLEHSSSDAVRSDPRNPMIRSDPCTSLLTPLNRAPSVVVTGSLSNAKECPQSASASSDPIRSSAGSGRRERTTPHLPSLFGQQQSSETERGDRRKKRDGMVEESNLAP